jgi:hypothetical protein
MNKTFKVVCVTRVPPREIRNVGRSLNGCKGHGIMPATEHNVVKEFTQNGEPWFRLAARDRPNSETLHGQRLVPAKYFERR